MSDSYNDTLRKIIGLIQAESDTVDDAGNMLLHLSSSWLRSTYPDEHDLEVALNQFTAGLVANVVRGELVRESATVLPFETAPTRH